MAYITTEQVAEIRNNLKAAFPSKDGWKFSVRRKHGSSVDVTILSGPMNFEAWVLPEGCDWNGPAYLHPSQTVAVVTHNQVNPYAYNYHYTAQSADVLGRMLAIIANGHWDESDIQSDYFNVAFYYHLSIGDWDKPYQRKGG